MRLSKAKKEADKTSKIISDECVVIKIRTPFKFWYLSTWFTFNNYYNVSKTYINNYEFKGKVYYSTKDKK